MTRWIIGAVAAVIVVFIAVVVFVGVSTKPGKATYTVKRADLVRETTGIAKIESVNAPAGLGFTFTGRIKRIGVVEGQKVKEGDVLVELDMQQLDFEVAASEAAVKEAHAELAVLQIPTRKEEIQKAEEAVKRAELDVKEAALVLSNLETPEVPPIAQEWEVRQAELELEQARNRYNEAVYTRESLLKLPEPGALAVAEAKWKQARLEVRLAEAFLKSNEEAGFPHDYSGNLKPPARLQIAQNVERRREEEKIALAEYDRIKAGASEADKEAAKARALAAQSSYEMAKVKLEQMKNPVAPPKGSARQIAAAQLALTKAQSAERTARATLESLKRGPLPEELAAARAAVERAEKNLEKAKAHRGMAVLRAPFDGTVVGRYYEVGSTPPPNSPVIAVADLNHLRARAELDIDVLKDIRPGQKAVLSGKVLGTTGSGEQVRLSGTIDRMLETIGPRTLFSRDPSQPKGGEVVTVLVELDQPGEDAPQARSSFDSLRPGLRLDVEVQFEKHEAVLSVPRSFVVVENRQPVVYKTESHSRDHTAPGKPVAVELGFHNDFSVEIKSGLTEGDVLVRPPVVANHLPAAFLRREAQAHAIETTDAARGQ